MALTSEDFRAGDVYLDYRQEKVMFHYVSATGAVFRWFYEDATESEVPYQSELFAEAQRLGVRIPAERYGRVSG